MVHDPLLYIIYILNPVHFQSGIYYERHLSPLPRRGLDQKFPPETKPKKNRLGGLDGWLAFNSKLVGGWTNPSEKYAQVKLGSSSPSRGENKKYLKPPPRKGVMEKRNMTLYALNLWSCLYDPLSSMFSYADKYLGKLHCCIVAVNRNVCREGKPQNPWL